MIEETLAGVVAHVLRLDRDVAFGHERSELLDRVLHTLAIQLDVIGEHEFSPRLTGLNAESQSTCGRFVFLQAVDESIGGTSGLEGETVR